MNAAKKSGLFMDKEYIEYSLRVVKRIHAYLLAHPNSNNNGGELRIADAIIDSAPPGSLRYIYLYINGVDVEDWYEHKMTDQEIAEAIVQNAIESDIAGGDFEYFKRKVKSDLALIDYLEGKKLSSAQLRNAAHNLDKDTEYLSNRARKMSRHNVFRYPTIVNRDAHIKKVATLRAALANLERAHVIIEHPNKSRSLGTRIRQFFKRK